MRRETTRRAMRRYLLYCFDGAIVGAVLGFAAIASIDVAMNRLEIANPLDGIRTQALYTFHGLGGAGLFGYIGYRLAHRKQSIGKPLKMNYSEWTRRRGAACLIRITLTHISIAFGIAWN